MKEQNKMIAEFLGIIPNVFDKEQYISSKWPNKLYAKPYEMEYHTSWDWLMQVVEKIERLGYDSRICGNNSDGGFLCDFVDAENNETACAVSYGSKIEAVYSAVTDFITWYNTTKK